MDRKEAEKLINEVQAIGAARNSNMLDKLIYLIDRVEMIERNRIANLARQEAHFQHELDVARNPRNAVLHSPDSEKWRKMAALIMRPNI